MRDIEIRKTLLLVQFGVDTWVGHGATVIQQWGLVIYKKDQIIYMSQFIYMNDLISSFSIF